jgi:MFS transporter, PAT family, beta-lactamase induction signal transducer AmpG
MPPSPSSSPAPERSQPLGLRLGVLSSLYASQGLPFGFFSHAVPVLLSRDHPPSLVGLSSLLAIPWGLKFLWAPWFDRVKSERFGRRRVLLVPLQLATVVALVVLGLLEPSTKHLTPLLVGFFVVSLTCASQDIATDALALDVLAPRERGLGNGVQVGAYRLGMIAGGGGLLAIVDDLGYREAFFAMAAMVLLASGGLFVMREPRVHGEHAHAGAGGFALLRSFATRPDARAIVVLLVAYKLGDALAAGMTTRFLVKQGLDTSDIALSRGLVGGLASVAGALGIGLLLRSWPRRRALVMSATLQALAVLVYLAISLARPVGSESRMLPLEVYYAASIVEHLFGGAATAALFTRMMDACRPDARATDFTVQASILVGVTGLGLALSGFVVGAVGHTAHFALSAALAVLTLPVVAKLSREPADLELRAPDA